MSKTIIVFIVLLLNVVVASEPDTESAIVEDKGSIQESVPTANVVFAGRPKPSNRVTGSLTNREVFLSSGVLLLGIFVISLQHISLRQSKDRVAPKDVLLVYVVSLVVVGTLFMISAGWSSSQIAPALGLFGTLIGYLLGRNRDEGEAEK